VKWDELASSAREVSAESGSGFEEEQLLRVEERFGIMGGWHRDGKTWEDTY
jgi:hypothetical protein